MIETKLEHQTRAILNRSYPWERWRNALQTVLDQKRVLARVENAQPIFCVDASEVVEFILPRSLYRSEYPSQLDLGLSILFNRPRKLFILGPHAEELAAVAQSWRERIEAAIVALDNVRVVKEHIDRELDEREKDQVLSQLVDLVKRERATLLGAGIGTADQFENFYQSVARRLYLPRSEDLGLLPTWRYKPNEDRIAWWFDRLNASMWARPSPNTHDIDAHALDLIEQINAALPPNRFLFFYTHSGKIWDVVEKIRSSNDGESFLSKNGISLLRPPEVELVQAWLEEASEQDRFKRQGEAALGLERSKGLKDLRGRLRTLLDPQVAPKPAEQDIAMLVGSLVEALAVEVSKLEERTREWESLQKFKANLKVAHEEEVRGLWPKFLKLLRSLDEAKRSELRELLQKDLDSLIEEMGDLQEKISASFLPPSPEGTLSFVPLEKPKSESVRAILRSQPSRTAPPVYAFRFMSADVRQHLLSIQKQLDVVAGGVPDEVEGARVELRRLMYVCERDLSNQPEFSLLLASVYSSLSQWFLAYSAAESCLKELWPESRGRPMSDPVPSTEKAVVTCEFLLAAAYAKRSWTLDEYADLRYVASGFLAQAAGLIRRCLALQRAWAPKLKQCYADPANDPRGRRELGSIYANAWEAGIPLDPHPEDLTVAGVKSIPAGVDSRLLLYRCFADQAYQRRAHDKTPRMEAYYLNSHLNALTLLDRPEDRAILEKAVEAFSGLEETYQDPNLLDTLAWHHYLMATRRPQEDQPANQQLNLAWGLIQNASKVASLDARYPKSRYYKEVFRKHFEAIRAAATKADLAPA